MEPRDILNELGGYREVATHLNLPKARVHNWTRRGIASKFWPDIVKLAQSKGKTAITFEVLQANSPSGRNQTEAA